MPLTNPSDLPSFSFHYGGKLVAGPPSDWQHLPPETAPAPGGSVTTTNYDDPATGLRVTVQTRHFDEFPALDWVMELENRGAADTPLIEEVLPLDFSAFVAAGERLRLHHANGSSCRVDDFLPLTTDLPPRRQVTLAPLGGRSSNGTLPFMNLQGDAGGLVIAIGWSGQWAASFERAADSARLTAGMQRTRLRLHPGETIRTPRILVIAWEGDDPEVGNNLLRQLLLAHYLPRCEGELVTPPVAQCLQAYYYLTGQAGEQFELAALPRAAAAGATAYWIDACWYGGGAVWYEAVGSWEVNRERFPNGLRPISDAARAAGMRFVLWFEPERVRAGSSLHRAHPEFLLSSAADPVNFLLNLGSPEARAYIAGLISARIAEHGVDIYRQDFNFDPLPYWHAADLPDREGMTEIRYVEGLYTLWDELRQRHPGLWIDNCASGGRRIDLETLSRSLPLWPSDFPDIIGLAYGQELHAGDQCINAGLARWVPLFGGGVWEFTPYGTRGQIIGGFNFGFHIPPDRLPPGGMASAISPQEVLARGYTLLDEAFPWDALRAAIAEWQSARPFFLGDFHLLLPLTASGHDWCAWQLHRADMHAGIALFLRRHRSPFPAAEVALKWVDPHATYAVSLSADYEEAPRADICGQELMNLTVSIPQAPGSLLLRYTKRASA